ncbi:peptide-methionine (R)-S-oxide reductase MsrB [Aliidiomarina soli]|uniref:Peptide methionine sulfoxide reductase MsrB n=1 Tax=Aliidiomarina soli TaxID=1928574 RepID=A0A432WM85_9GAMM|nr:peptide-methionine (R)-S-oxide reductase MsrB [Aliidiomarina soli]RUO34932.1 peptide-methionine (R)-S-oxide reductase [Aliidiomarina soli]
MSDQAEWRKRLTPEAYRVLREKGTERPFSGALLDENRPGIYVCAGCGQELFSAQTKFDAGCGWPSFYASLGEQVEYNEDTSHGMQRIEITCKQCGGHLGHVFPDGPAPTGQRYCVNSVALEFKADEG